MRKLKKVKALSRRMLQQVIQAKNRFESHITLLKSTIVEANNKPQEDCRALGIRARDKVRTVEVKCRNARDI